MNFKLGFAAILAGLLVAGGVTMAADSAYGNGTGASGSLPHADGREFATLDAYLAHLQHLGTIGIAWYERMPDGRYQLVMRRPPHEAPEVFTREELLERFGFED
jgi:hypothetical protein